MQPAISPDMHNIADEVRVDGRYHGSSRHPFSSIFVHLFFMIPSLLSLLDAITTPQQVCVRPLFSFLSLYTVYHGLDWENGNQYIDHDTTAHILFII